MGVDAFSALMAQGAHSFEAGQLNSALALFQQARKLNPNDAQALFACATVMSALGQHDASYRLLDSHQTLFADDADGMANLAIAAETVGEHEQSANAYACALELDPNHVRVLNNLALRESQAGQWDDAIAKLQRCVALSPQEPALWINLIDFLNGAKRDDDALVQTGLALRQFPDHPELIIRRFVCLAFAGQLDAAHQALRVFGGQEQQVLDAYLKDAASSLPRQFQKHAMTTPDAFEFYCVRSFDAMNTCDWRRNTQLADWLMQKLAHVQKTGEIRDWRDTQFYALFLDFSEAQEAALRGVTLKSLAMQFERHPAHHSRDSFFTTQRPNYDARIHIGISTQYLGDARYRQGLLTQLRWHDHQRFAFHLYSPLQTSDTAGLASLRHAGAEIVEVGHLGTQATVDRIRHDRLDLWMDDAYFTPWCRPEILHLRVAPIQMRRQQWSREEPLMPSDYIVGDRVTHPDGDCPDPHGKLVRFGSTCWLPCGGDLPDHAMPTRASAGLPTNAMVLTCNAFALAIEPSTFDSWMTILRRVPEAILWLPAYSAPVQANLAREAQNAGVDPARIRHAPKLPRLEMLAHLALADLYVDTLRFNAPEALVDFLKCGIPALTVKGHNMASRLGASVLTAAGLGDCAFDDARAYEEAAIELCLKPDKLQTLKMRLSGLRKTAPLFDEGERVREWERAWSHMVTRDRAGLPPAPFDLPGASTNNSP